MGKSREMVDSSMRSITAYDEAHRYVFFDERVQDLLSIEPTSGGSEDGAALLMNFRDLLRGEPLPVVFSVCVEALVSPLDSIYVSHLVVVPEGHHNFSDDDVQTWAEATACHDANLRLLRVEEDVLSWARLQKLGGYCYILERGVVFSCNDEGLVRQERVNRNVPRALRN